MRSTPPKICCRRNWASFGNIAILLIRHCKLGTKNAKHAPGSRMRNNPPSISKNCRFLQLWHEDGGHFITLPLVYTESPIDRKTQSRHLPNAALRRDDDRNALADRQGRRISLFRSRAAGTKPLAGHGFPRRAAGDDAVGGRAAARRRAGADACFASGRRERSRRPRIRSGPIVIA